MISRVLSSFAVLACLFAAGPAFAQNVPGCDPAVTSAMVAKGQALVGYDISVVQEAFAKPDSVLNLTCFNKAAGLDATEAGKIFSEDFLAPLKDLIEPWLTAFNDEFQDAAGQGASGWMPAAYAAASAVLDSSGPSGTAADCGYIEKWWTEDSASGGTNLGYKNKGIQLNIPYITLDILRGAGVTPGGAGANFTQKWNQVESINNVRSNLDTALTALAKPTMPAAGFTGQNTICAVLTQGGITCP